MVLFDNRELSLNVIVDVSSWLIFALHSIPDKYVQRADAWHAFQEMIPENYQPVFQPSENIWIT